MKKLSFVLISKEFAMQMGEKKPGFAGGNTMVMFSSMWHRKGILFLMPALLVVGLLMNGCEKTSSVTEPDLSNVSIAKGNGNRGQIVFSSNRDGNYEIYVMNPDGTGLTNLTNNSATDGDPAWSPDGRQIAFSSNRDGNYEIYVMNADGTGLTRLTYNSADDIQPTWSPHSRQIAFESYRDGNAEIYVMDADGTGLTNVTNNQADDANPAWSPDGRQIAFSSTRDGDFEIYIMNPDGTALTRLTYNPAWDVHPQMVASQR